MPSSHNITINSLTALFIFRTHYSTPKQHTTNNVVRSAFKLKSAINSTAGSQEHAVGLLLKSDCFGHTSGQVDFLFTKRNPLPPHRHALLKNIQKQLNR